MRTQNKTITVYRALNVEYTEVNLELKQPVWHFCLEKDFSALLGCLQQTGQKCGVLFFLFVWVFCVLLFVFLNYIALSCFHDAVPCSCLKADSSRARKGNGGEDECL